MSPRRSRSGRAAEAGAGAVAQPPKEPLLIECERVTVYRGQRPALKEFSISIGVGEHVAILGPNGSGKSTLIKTIARECYPLQRPGSWMRILGRENWNIFELRSLLGIVTHDWQQACTREFTAEEIVLSGFFSSVGVWPHHHVTAEQREQARQALEMMEAGHLAHRPMDELSTGEARRVMVARALVHQPKTLLLDEPTASLDIQATYQLREILRRLAQAGVGLIIVTHQLHDIIPEIDRVVLLREGRVFADGSKHRLLRADVLRELFGMPVEVLRRDGYYHLW